MSTVRRRSGARQRRWSKQEYYLLGELGFFRGQRVELIEGTLMVFSPQNSEHAAGVLQVSGVLQNLFGAGYHIRPQVLYFY